MNHETGRTVELKYVLAADGASYLVKGKDASTPADVIIPP